MRKTPRVRVAELVAGLAAPIAERHGLELVEVEYVREGGSWYVRVFIDKPGGISHDDCQLVSHELDAQLDELDPVPHAYFLEVSSPGVERPLKTDADFSRFQGAPVAVHCYRAIAGQKRWQGRLAGATPADISLETASGRLTVPREAVARVHLVYEPERPAGGRKKG